jgi:histidyl-tRNA synthetase
MPFLSRSNPVLCTHAAPPSHAQGFDREGNLRAICGGGRYNRLLSLYGSPTEIPACGFGFGDCVLMELLTMKNKIPKLPQCAQFVVVAYDEAMFAPSLRVAAMLRKAGYTVDQLLEPTRKVKNAFSYADRVGGQRVVFVAPDEWNNGCVRIKDLRTGAPPPREGGQEEASKGFDVKFDELVDTLKKMQI